MDVEFFMDTYDVPAAFEKARLDVISKFDEIQLQLTLVSVSMVWTQRDRVREKAWKYRFIAGPR